MLVHPAHRLLSESSLIVRTRCETGRLRQARRMVRTKGALISKTGVEYHQMHWIELGQIIRDAEVANAISPIVHGHSLTEEDTEKALLELHVPRAANVARIIYR
jgi:hypothetical protein